MSACKGIIDAAEGYYTILKFKITAWACEVEGRGDDGHVVFETGCEGAAVDIVKFVGEEPWVLGIVNFELAIR